MSTYEKGRAYKVRYRGHDWWPVVNDGSSFLPWYIYGKWIADSEVTDVRPLIVLDPEDERVAAFLAEGRTSLYSPTSAALHRLIAEQIAPPRIPEPGWGAVVRAERDNRATLWQRQVRGGRYWISSGGYTELWSDLIDPVLVRPAVEEES